MPSSYLAIDLGASSGRAVLGRFDGERMTLEELHRFQTPLVERQGHLFWDLAALWAEVCRGVELALDASPELRSVSVDSWAVDYVPLDQAGVALRDAFAYRDPRTRGLMARAHALIPAEELYRRTGIQMLEINTIYQLLADLDAEPELLRRTSMRLPIADYLLYRLTGVAAVERTMASTTQLMDVHEGAWATDLIARLGLPESGWPEIVPPGTVLGPLRSGPALPSVPASADAPRDPEEDSARIAAAVRVAERADEPAVIAGCSHDTAAAVAAVPARSAAEGRGDDTWAYISCGTWSLLGVERSEPILTEAAREANFTNESGLDGTIRFLKNLTGLWVLQECERAWRTEVDAIGSAELVAEAEAAKSLGGVLDLNDPRFAARGDMPARLLEACTDRELGPPSTRGELVRLILESLAVSYDSAVRELEGVLGERVDVLHVVGGGSQNTLLCQLTADACGRRLVAGPAEATALGNLVVQARTLGDLPPDRSIREIVLASSELSEYQPITRQHEASFA